MDLLDGLPDVMTVSEAAKVLRVGHTTMYRLISQGDVKCLRIGRKIVIPRTYLRSFIEHNSEL